MQNKKSVLPGTLTKVEKYATGRNTARLESIKRAGLVDGVPGNIATEVAVLLHASLARGTWEKYSSAWAAFDAYQAYVGLVFEWPLTQDTIRGFAAFLFSVRKLKTTSIRSYLSAMSCLHKLKGFPNHHTTDDVLNSIMRGAENLQMAEPPAKHNTRRVMTVALLRHLGHRLAESGWEKEAVQTIWSAALIAFFGTARMGEILSHSESWVDRTSVFTWSCVKYREEKNSFLLQIKLAKMRYIDLFPFDKIPGLCPVAALKKQHKRQLEMGKGGPADPVFIYPSGNFVTTGAYNKALRVLLADVVDFERDSISCHSFRAGLPSLIAQYPELFSAEDIKKWGRWEGESFNKYTRLTDTSKEKMFDKMKIVIS